MPKYVALSVDFQHPNVCYQLTRLNGNKVTLGAHIVAISMHSLTIDDAEDSETEVSDNIRRRSTINLGNQRQRNLRRIRLKVYNFLEKPLNAASAPYHFFIFGLVIANIILGAATNDNDSTVSKIHFFLEIFMIVFFILEFAVRLWSVRADAKYRTKYGRLYYLFHTVTLIDILIIPATILLLVFKGHDVDGSTLDTLRFIQILRLFHVDRQMATWKLLRKMIILGKWQLMATYYITLVVGLSLATIVYSTEALAQGIQDNGYGLIVPEGTNATFPTMAHSWWFTAVTVMTVGYGDIYPVGALTKFLVCVLGFIAFCTFQAANTQISVGLTLMMEEENKNQQTNRLRNLAASTIQCWWRYHLATNWKPPRRYTYFVHVCYKLYVTEERINQNRVLAKKLREKLEKKRPIKKKSLTHQNSVTAEILKFGFKGMAKPMLEKQDSFDKAERKISLRRTRKRVLFAEARNSSVETSMSSSVDVSELETQFEITNFLEQNVDELSSKGNQSGRSLLWKPQGSTLAQTQRIAGQLLMIEAEIAERENQRNQKMKELEAAILELTGKPTVSPFDDSGQKLSIIERLEFCEKRMEDLERKTDALNEITIKCLNLMMMDTQEAASRTKDEQGLPPKPPSANNKKQRTIGPRRQVTIVDQYDTLDDCETVSLDRV
nr:probable potassium channel - Caenorhabditis elegans [Caenorhabditis elegans]